MSTEHIRYEDTLRQGTDKINAAIDQANKAEKDSAEALDTANQALFNSESTQNQLDQIVIEGDSSVEAAQARVNYRGDTFSTLKERIDNLDQEFEERAISIKWFGAVGDGAVDDTSAILQAVSQANTLGVGVKLPAGTYAIQYGTVLECDNITISGEGRFMPLSGSTGTSLLTLRGNNNTLKGLVLTEGESKPERYLEIDGDNNVVEWCKAYGLDRYETETIPWSEQAINVIGNGNIIRYCEVYNAGLGINVQNFDNKVLFCKIHDNVVGMRLQASCRGTEIGYNNIYGNNITDASGADGILGHRNVSKIWIHHNKIYNNGEHGIYFQGDNSIIESNIVNENFNAGIKLASYKTDLFWHPDETPDQDYIGHNNIVRGNICNENTQVGGTASGIYLQSPLRDIIVSDNITDNNLSGSGIRSVFLNDGETLENLSFTNNRVLSGGMSIHAHKNINISGNTVEGTLLLYSDTTQNNQDSIVENNIAERIDIARSDNARVLNNVTEKFVIASNSNETIMVGNLIKNQDEDLNVRRVAEFKNNELHLVGDTKIISDVGASQLKNFSHNRIFALDAQSDYIFMPAFNITTDNLRMIANHFEVPSSLRVLRLWGEKMAISHNYSNSSSPRVYDIYGSDSTITGNVGTVAFQSGSSGNVAVANIGGYGGDTTNNTVIG